MKGSPRVVLLLYVLMAYVIAQFCWWAYLIYDLNVEILSLEAQLRGEALADEDAQSKLLMIFGEGSVFMLLLLIGAAYIRKFILRENRLAKQERNFLLATTHEFNSPIAAIKLNIQTLLRRDIEKPKQHEILNNALSANQRLELLVSNILTASRLDSGRYEVMPERSELHEVLQNLQRRFQGIASQSGNALITDAPDAGSVEVEARTMELILGNLIENALKYAPGTQVTLRATREGDAWHVSVIDEGPGISKEEKRSVFRKFYRSENEETRSQKGTGLGLYLVKQLAELHGATVTLSDNHPKGSIFTLILKATTHGNE